MPSENQERSERIARFKKALDEHSPEIEPKCIPHKGIDHPTSEQRIAHVKHLLLEVEKDTDWDASEATLDFIEGALWAMKAIPHLTYRPLE